MRKCLVEELTLRLASDIKKSSMPLYFSARNSDFLLIWIDIQVNYYIVRIIDLLAGS